MEQISDEFHAVERDVRRRAVVSEVVRNMAIVLMIIFVWTAMYAARRHDANFSRAGCVRAALGYLTNAGNWEVAAGVRRAEGDIQVADEYQRRAERLRRLAGVGPATVNAFRASEARRDDVVAHPPRELVVVCRERFPQPSFFVLER